MVLDDFLSHTHHLLNANLSRHNFSFLFKKDVKNQSYGLNLVQIQEADHIKFLRDLHHSTVFHLCHYHLLKGGMALKRVFIKVEGCLEEFTLNVLEDLSYLELLLVESGEVHHLHKAILQTVPLSFNKFSL